MFKGIQKVSLVDFPGVIAATLFTGGCNFNCGWCHNRPLVDKESLSAIPDIDEETIKAFLNGRKSKLGGICVTGGEPTIWGDKLLDFIKWARNEGFLVKLDTNGYLPGVLHEYIESRTLDFIAMDIKNSPESYAVSCGIADINVNRILESVKLIQESGIKHQFRTTMVPGIVAAENIEAFYREIKEPFIGQEYRDVSVMNAY